MHYCKSMPRTPELLMCALATFSCKELKTLIIDNLGFREYLGDDIRGKFTSLSQQLEHMDSPVLLSGLSAHRRQHAGQANSDPGSPSGPRIS